MISPRCFDATRGFSFEVLANGFIPLGLCELFYYDSTLIVKGKENLFSSGTGWFFSFYNDVANVVTEADTSEFVR